MDLVTLTVWCLNIKDTSIKFEFEDTHRETMPSKKIQMYAKIMNTEFFKDHLWKARFEHFLFFPIGPLLINTTNQNHIWKT